MARPLRPLVNRNKGQETLAIPEWNTQSPQIVNLSFDYTRPMTI